MDFTVCLSQDPKKIYTLQLVDRSLKVYFNLYVSFFLIPCHF